MKSTFDFDEYYNSLPMIKYSGIIELLKDQSQPKDIYFCSTIAIPGSGAMYHYVVVRYIGSGKQEEFLSPDQIVEDIDINLHKTLICSDLGFIFYHQYNFVHSYAATLEKNTIYFPTRIAERIYEEFNSSSQNIEQIPEEKVRTRLKEKIFNPDDLPFEI